MQEKIICTRKIQQIWTWMKAERSDQASNKSDNVSNTETDIGFGEELISRGSWKLVVCSDSTTVLKPLYLVTLYTKYHIMEQ